MNENPEEIREESLTEPFARLSKDMKDAARELSIRDARFLVDEYYIWQGARIRSASQQRTHEEAGEPHSLLVWESVAKRRVEGVLKSALGEFARSYAAGQWLQAHCGVADVISAGLLARFDIRKAPTVGHFWRFAGLDPTLKWHGKDKTEKKLKELGITKKEKNLTADNIAKLSQWSGQHAVRIQSVWDNGFVALKGPPAKKYRGLEAFFSARPFNMKLKTLCLEYLGGSFNRQKGRDACYYGHLMDVKSKALWSENLSGKFSDTATNDIATVRYGKDTSAYAFKVGCYKPEEVMQVIAHGKTADQANKGEPGSGTPMLPPGQIFYRARRWTVKLFLSHLHHVMHVDYHQAPPPHPYIFEHPNGEDHRHLIEPHLWPGDFDGRPLKELYDK